MNGAIEKAPDPELKVSGGTSPPPPPPLPGWIVSTARWASFHIAEACRRVWARRGAPSVIFGAVLVGTALVVVPSSTWTLPIFALGTVLIAIGLLGSRLRILLGMKWQPEGLNINFNLGVDARTDRSAGETARSGAEGASALILPASASRTSRPSVAEEIEVLEGVAETMEFSAAEIEGKMTDASAGEKGHGQRPDKSVSSPDSAS